MNRLLLIIFIVGFKTTFTQTFLKNFDGDNIGYFKNNVFYVNDDKPLYNIQGQIIFNDTSNNRKDIALTVELLKKKIKIYEGVGTNVKWLVQDKNIYFRTNQEDINVLKYQIKDGFTSFYKTNNDSLFAFIPSENISELEISLVFYYLWNFYDLEYELVHSAKNLQNTNELPEGVVAYMKPVFGDPLNVWVWDGTFLYQAYDADPFFVWTFDGSTLKPQYNSRIENEWSWDGEELRPYWGGHPRNNWRWEGNILRQVFENNYKNEFEIVDNVIRKRFGSFNDLEWEIHGEMPLPLITLIALGIVYR